MKILSRTLTVLGLCLITQCTTSKEGVNQLDPVKATAVVKATVPSAVRIGISKEPKSERYFLLAATTIDLFAFGNDLAPDALTKALDSIGNEILKTVEARAVVDSVQALYVAFYADIVKQKLDERNLIPVLQAMADAIRKGAAD